MYTNIYIKGYSKRAIDFENINGNYLSNDLVDCTFIVKLDNYGNFLWTKNMVYQNVFESSITLDAKGNIFNIGVGYSTLNTDTIMNIIISKLDSLGNLLWEFNIG